MLNRLAAATLAGAFLLPATAQAQSRLDIPEVELYATVTGKWVLNPRRCKDIREDVRDARSNDGRRDRREDRRDQRVADCPASAYDFVAAPGQGPKYPVRIGRGPVERQYRGRPMFINGDTIGENGMPPRNAGGGRGYGQGPRANQTIYPQPTYQQPSYQQPSYTQPTYTQPTYSQPSYSQPTYTQPTYQQPSYQAPAPSKPSNYEVRGGVIYFLD